ncbi:prolyl oligopeptidase family serine peptidase [Streptomyces albipurpureus]|uniref:Prolyl oligopeptidase family serine peptidase n=1 Tax=Streptomyces albipurpureus TaxID=2897419 RepID=A0ABT0UGU9_9ACTN|nr:prolyl oligopeptidase family serine peptidase [Streptomyces sp. CWNU-1]MCM2387678.1 prolyl oligopeptidase family serine peptidase [Streptomyces sp. CWNU-1]
MSEHGRHPQTSGHGIAAEGRARRRSVAPSASGEDKVTERTADASVAVPRFPRQFARTRRFSLGLPRHFTVSPDGRRVLFIRGTSGADPVSRLWLHENGDERLLADPLTLSNTTDSIPDEERVRRERAREASSGVVSYATDNDALIAVFALNGELWTVRTDRGEPRRIPTAGPVVDPRPSPDGSRIAYVTGGALHVVGIDGTDDRALAAPESAEVTYGLSDHASAESMGRLHGYWWSPDGVALLVARVDNSPVQRWYICDPADPTKKPTAVAYPQAGTANAKVSLHLVHTAGRAPVEVRLPTVAPEETHPEGEWTDTSFEYIPVAGWDGLGPFAQVQTRDQRTVQLLAIDANTGATESLDIRHDPAWVELVPGAPRRLPSGAVLRTFICDDGLTGLSLDGVRTPRGLNVREVTAVSDERIHFLANEEPTEVHVWRYDPADGFTRVSEGPGVYAVAVGGDTVVLDSRTQSGRSVTVSDHGVERGRIAVLTEEPVVTPQPIHHSLGKRELRSQLYLPSWYEQGSGRLPVLLNPYSGVGMQLVVRAREWWTCVSQWFAEQGFAVLVTDGRGTPGRGREWEKAIRGDRLTPALRDQIDALHAAAEQYPDLDLTAVAIRGWSYGGYLAAGAVLRHPEVFHAAVAGGTPTDRRLYDTHWEERFLGHPEVFPQAYRRSSLVPDAHLLSRPLLLVHGVADDNVHVAHTLRLSAALVAAGRPHTVLPLSGATHLVTGTDQASGLLLLEASFLRNSLNL